MTLTTLLSFKLVQKRLHPAASVSPLASSSLSSIVLVSSGWSSTSSAVFAYAALVVLMRLVAPKRKAHHDVDVEDGRKMKCKCAHDDVQVGDLELTELLLRQQHKMNMKRAETMRSSHANDFQLAPG